MNLNLVVGVSIAALLVGPAHAQVAVIDGANLVNTAQSVAQGAAAAGRRVEMINNQIVQIEHLRNTLAAVSHGNLAALSDLVSELGGSDQTNPFGADTTALVQSLAGLGGALGATASLGQDMLRTDQFYAPTGTDFRAIAMNQAAASIASQKAMAELALQTSGRRLDLLTDLRNRLSSTTDIKAATDANARLTGEQATAQVQGNQIAALQALQRAQTATNDAREQQAWRCSAEAMVADAKSAGANADAGMVTLVSQRAQSPCLTAATQQANSTTANTTGSLTQPAVADDGTALNKMLAQPWGQQAADNATALGVNPTALAATCALESNCQANPGGTGTISGAFQMSNGTYAQTVSEVQSSNPDLAASITTKDDPASQSIAAAQYLSDGAKTLQTAGIANPTVMDVRGYYQFGPGNAASLANAADNQLMITAVSNLSSSTLAANNISSSTTVGQWRSTVTGKIGTTADQPVLVGGVRT